MRLTESAIETGIPLTIDNLLTYYDLFNELPPQIAMENTSSKTYRAMLIYCINNKIKCDKTIIDKFYTEYNDDVVSSVNKLF